jgi:uncharacterized protein
MELIDSSDTAHDFMHAQRVMHNAIEISDAEGGDLDVLVPAALFHDVVMYPKNDPRSLDAPAASAAVAASVLQATDTYPARKIPLVTEAIRLCSFANDADGATLESAILQDADRLEATGAIAIMRTFWSAGQMSLPLYDAGDPFAEHRDPDGLQYALDLFETRLLRVESRMNTATGRRLARERSTLLHVFLEAVRQEIS